MKHEFGRVFVHRIQKVKAIAYTAESHSLGLVFSSNRCTASPYGIMRRLWGGRKEDLICLEETIQEINKEKQ